MDIQLNDDINEMLKIKGIFNASPTSINLIPRMVEHKTALDTRLSDIFHLAQKTGTTIHGFYLAKSSSKNDLVLITEAGCAAIRSHGNATHNQEMADAAKWKAYQLEPLHKNDLIAKSTTFLAQATTLGAALAPYGFDAADLSDWASMLTAYTNAAEEPGVKVEIHKTDLDDLKKMVADGLRWLKNDVDVTAIAYKRKDPSFYKLYTFSRQKHKQGYRHRKPGEPETNTPGEFVLDILKGGNMAVVGFPLLADTMYLVENTKNTELRYWAQAEPEPPQTIPTDASILEIDGSFQHKGALLGAPQKPYFFFGNASVSEDGQVAINVVEEN